MTLRNLFANTAVTCERQVDGETQRLNMETNLLDEAEKLIRFLQPAPEKRRRKHLSVNFFCPENIRVRIRQKNHGIIAEAYRRVCSQHGTFRKSDAEEIFL